MRISLPEINSDGSYTFGPAKMDVDGDGANGQTHGIPCYAPRGWGKTWDDLRNAGESGNWYGIVTHNGKAGGTPVIQQPGDPAPGAYVSATAYEDTSLSRGNPLRYLDAASVIYIVVPGHWRQEAKGVVLGCKAMVKDTHTGQVEYGIVGDFGPRSKIGEVSIACAQRFNPKLNPKNGEDSKRYIYQFWPGVAVEGFKLISA